MLSLLSCDFYEIYLIISDEILVFELRCVKCRYALDFKDLVQKVNVSLIMFISITCSNENTLGVLC